MGTTPSCSGSRSSTFKELHTSRTPFDVATGDGHVALPETLPTRSSNADMSVGRSTVRVAVSWGVASCRRAQTRTVTPAHFSTMRVAIGPAMTPSPMTPTTSGARTTPPHRLAGSVKQSARKDGTTGPSPQTVGRLQKNWQKSAVWRQFSEKSDYLLVPWETEPCSWRWKIR